MGWHDPGKVFYGTLISGIWLHPKNVQRFPRLLTNRKTECLNCAAAVNVAAATFYPTPQMPVSVRSNICLLQLVLYHCFDNIQVVTDTCTRGSPEAKPCSLEILLQPDACTSRLIDLAMPGYGVFPDADDLVGRRRLHRFYLHKCICNVAVQSCRYDDRCAAASRFNLKVGVCLR